MRLAILSRGPQLYSTQRLHEAAVRRGHHVHIVNTLGLSVVVDHARPALLYGGRPLPPCDAVIPRIGASITLYGCAAVRQLEELGVYALNRAVPIGDARDKLRASQILAAAGVPIPTTVFVRSAAHVARAVAQVGGPPAMVKVLEGTQGVGVLLAEDVAGAQALVETLHQARQHVLIQRFVAESRGRDVRALVVGDRVVAAMRRFARPGEYRANVHRGGRIEAADLPPRYRDVAIAAVRALGLEVAGVDMLEARRGPLVIEVNSSPGLEGIEVATGVDVAGEILEHIEAALSPAAVAGQGG